MKKASWKLIFVIILGLAGTGIFSYITWNEAERSSGIDKEIDKLRQEAEKIRSDNQQLQEKISYFETDEFKEKVAKEKLNLQKPEEKVVIVKPSPFQENAEEVSDKEHQNQEKEIENYIKWWNQFFK